MPLLDASDRGVRVNLLVNGTKARTKLDVTRAQPQGGVVTYTSPEWTVDAAGNRTMMGWHGKKIVAVADHYHWLDYLADTRWRPFFQTQVSGSTIGSWNESSTTTIRDKQTRAGNYQMGMNAGTLYIGYSPSTNQYFTGDIERVGGDPGCDGT
jgi:UDP-2,3-diacylglucosamine pyrophosphatase LpxH